MKTDFPLSDQEADTMRAGLANKILALHDVEATAVQSLTVGMG
jgi:hypothetical protein